MFHSAMGLTPGVISFADQLRAAGHTVHTPDYYDGQVFGNLIDGIAYRDELGIAEIAQRGVAAAQELPAELVYAGFSLGCGPAQLLAQTRPGAVGALLMHGCLPAGVFDVPWPTGLPLAVHVAEKDQWADIPTARALTSTSDGELFLYPGDSHLFADPGIPDFEPESAALMTTRILTWLAARDGRN